MFIKITYFNHWNFRFGLNPISKNSFAKVGAAQHWAWISGCQLQSSHKEPPKCTALITSFRQLPVFILESTHHEDIMFSRIQSLKPRSPRTGISIINQIKWFPFMFNDKNSKSLQRKVNEVSTRRISFQSIFSKGDIVNFFTFLASGW